MLTRVRQAAAAGDFAMARYKLYCRGASGNSFKVALWVPAEREGSGGRASVARCGLLMLGSAPSEECNKMLDTYSRFGGLWIDRLDSEDVLAERRRSGLYSTELADKIEAFMRDGYVVLKGAVSKEETSALRAEIEAFWQNPHAACKMEAWIPGWDGGRVIPVDIQYRVGMTKLHNFHAFSDRMRRAIANRQAIEFLHAIFECRPKAFQGLTFWHGSQQPMHKDSAYVRVEDAPKSLAASWLALEDVVEGTGELQYYVGSHRTPDFIFGGHGKWLTDAPDDHPKFLQRLHDDAARFDHKKGSFLAKEGDVLIWHADLAHGGAKVLLDGHTRQSHVTHYTGEFNHPIYTSGIIRPEPFEVDGCLFISNSKEIP